MQWLRDLFARFVAPFGRLRPTLVEWGTYTATNQPKYGPRKRVGSRFRVVHMAVGTGFFGRAFFVVSECFLHPTVTSYLVCDGRGPSMVDQTVDAN